MRAVLPGVKVPSVVIAVFTGEHDLRTRDALRDADHRSRNLSLHPWNMGGPRG